MNNNLIVAFAGRIGAGKSSVSAAVAEELGLNLASFGGFVGRPRPNAAWITHGNRCRQ
jgi:cytidylate kinase